jgi:hypothetical protein
VKAKLSPDEETELLALMRNRQITPDELDRGYNLWDGFVSVELPGGWTAIVQFNTGGLDCVRWVITPDGRRLGEDDLSSAVQGYAGDPKFLRNSRWV